MKQYQEYLQHILDHGTIKGDRTGTGTKSVFGYQMRFNLQEGFPLLTTKDMSGIRWEGIKRELKWFLNGDTNIRYLLEHGINIWNGDAYRWHLEQFPDSSMTKERFLEVIQMGDRDIHNLGELGRIYGKQWRSWDVWGYGHEGTIDQIDEVIEQIKKNPDSRRLIVTAWRPDELNDVALPPCHVLFQFYVADGKLSCQLYQRSADSFLGVPYNIASYALLVHLMANVLELEVGDFVHTIGDAHIYLNHIAQVETQLTREPKPLPQLVIKRQLLSIDDFEPEDIELVGYDAYGSLKGDVSVG